MREKIRLVSTAGTGHFYTTTKNRRTHPEKMEVKKSRLLSGFPFPGRPPRAQARHLQGSQDQVVSAPPLSRVHLEFPLSGASISPSLRLPFRETA